MQRTTLALWRTALSASISPATGLVNYTQNIFLKSTFCLYGFINEQACKMSQE